MVKNLILFYLLIQKDFISNFVTYFSLIWRQDPYAKTLYFLIIIIFPFINSISHSIIAFPLQNFDFLFLIHPIFTPFLECHFFNVYKESYTYSEIVNHSKNNLLWIMVLNCLKSKFFSLWVVKTSFRFNLCFSLLKENFPSLLGIHKMEFYNTLSEMIFLYHLLIILDLNLGLTIPNSLIPKAKNSTLI